MLTYICKYENETPSIQELEAIKITDKKAFYKCDFRGTFSLELSCDRQEIKFSFEEAASFLIKRLIDENEYFNQKAIETEFWAESIKKCKSIEDFSSVQFSLDEFNKKEIDFPDANDSEEEYLEKELKFKQVKLFYGYKKVKNEY